MSKQLKMFCVAAWLLLLVTTASTASTDGLNTRRSWILQFKGMPVASLAINGATPVEQRHHHAGLATRLDAAAQSVAAANVPVIYRYTRLFFGLQVLASPRELRTLAALPGLAKQLVSISAVSTLKPTMDDSAAYIGATDAWELYGLQGEGITIGIIDSGIDYLHASFEGIAEADAYEANDGTTIDDTFGDNAQLLFPTPAVVGGWDFTGPGYSPGMEPTPDPDPMPDTNDKGNYADHGTHVAGTAAGRAAGAIAPGIAPKALLYALKVSSFGSTDLMPAAVEWASDPNQDGDLSDRLDVLNISLGSPYAGLPSSNTMAEQSIIESYIALGGLVAAAAGNEGDKPFIHSSPGSIPGVVGVANVHATGETAAEVEVTAPEDLVAVHPAIEANFEFTVKLENTGPISGPLVHIGKGCDAETVPDLTGSIALLERKECSFGEKFGNAVAKGAIAVVVVHHKDNQPNMINGNPFQEIPGITVWKDVGVSLIDALAEGSEITVTLKSVPKTDLDNEIWGPSSRGPAHTPTGLAAKPDISAPGVNIGSVEAGGPTNAKNASGTSMSSPHIAGVLALLRQAHPDWPESSIRAALMGTANPQITQGEGPASYTRQGAGLVRVVEAIATDLLLSSGPGITLDFGLVATHQSIQVERTITIQNFSDSPRSITLSVSDDFGPGVSLTVPENLTVEPNSTQDITATLSLDPSELSAWPLKNDRPDEWLLSERDLVDSVEYSARVVATADDGATAALPVWLIPKRVSEVSTNMGGCAPTPDSTLELSSSDTARTEIFTLVTDDERDEAIPAYADLAAIGLRLRSVDDQTYLEFAFSMYDQRTMPDEVFLATWIDWTGDNVADMVVSHFDQGYVEGDYPTDREYALALSLQDLVGDGVADIGLPAGYFDIINTSFVYTDLYSKNLVIPIPLTVFDVLPSEITMWTIVWDRYGAFGSANEAVDSSPNFGPLLSPATAPSRHTVNLECGLWKGNSSIEVTDLAVLDHLIAPTCAPNGLLLLSDSTSETEAIVLKAGAFDLASECPSTLVMTTDADSCTARITPPEPPQVENCQSSYTSTIKDDLDWPVGEHQTVLFLEDVWGGAATCEIVLQVVDQTEPSLSISDATVNERRATWTVAADDACGANWTATADCAPECQVATQGDKISVQPPNNVDTVTIEVRATDPSGNESIASKTAIFEPVPAVEPPDTDGEEQLTDQETTAVSPAASTSCSLGNTQPLVPSAVWMLLLMCLAVLYLRRRDV
jgi:subtilisin family serine protease